MYPQLAAQHLLDGLSIELLDGDSNIINMEWIKATLKNLEEQLSSGDINSKRIFVLSVMGVQSSGKSTLLNIIFGIQMRTSVGQCTRGVNMQLIPVSGRAEYDYILLLDTEGTRAPEYWGLPGSEKRDNQMATLSILLADATIIVNPGENDAAIKEILPIVLLAYQGSKLAEEKGGRLSCMVFFVYNRIDTQQKDKLGNILQILGTSLHDAFNKVSQLSGMPSTSPVTADNVSDRANQVEQNSYNISSSAASLFRRFKLDPSNLVESDVRILGNIKKNFLPPDDIPDPAYGENLYEFREHIHRRINERDLQSLPHQQWTSRSITEILEYLNLVWVCIRSSDFTLNFKTVIERATFDQLHREYKTCEKELTYIYYNSNNIIEKEILAKKYKLKVDRVHFDAMKLKLETLVDDKMKELDLDIKIKEALQQPGRSKWKNDFETQWAEFKSVEKQRWIDQLRTFFECQLNYELHVDECKNEMRLRIREMFTNAISKQCDNEPKEKPDFNKLFNGFLIKAKKKYPPINVGERVGQVYINNMSMKALQVNLLNSESVKRVMRDLKFVYDTDGHLSSTSTDNNFNYWQEFEQSVLAAGFKIFSKKNTLDSRQKMKDEIVIEIVHRVQYEQEYMDPIVDKVIASIINITNKYECKQRDKEYAHILAKNFVISCLETRQKNWESANSVSAKLAQESTKKEMEVYFNAVSRGIVATELLVDTLTANLFNILPEAFDKEMIRIIDSRIRTKTWLSDPKAVQARLDLALLKLIDGGKIREMLEKIKNSASCYEQVLSELISFEISKIKVKKECDSFITVLKNVINAAVKAASSLKRGRAKKFIDELHFQCLNQFEGNFLAINLITDSGGYEGCDNEEEFVFREKCLQLFERSTKYWPKQNSFNGTWKWKLNRQVMTYLRELRREDMARPRCKATCPQCGSLCIHPAGHQTLVIKHDTYHQPAGIAGVCWHSEIKNKISDSLCQETCSMQLKKARSIRLANGKVRQNKDFSKEYPKWMLPKLTERLPLREFIFANYQEEIAKKYKCKQCVEIPEYYHDVESIRSDLKRTAKLSQDYR